MHHRNMSNYKNIGAAVVILLFAIFLFVASFFVRTSTVTTLGPEFMPRLVSVVIFLLGLLNLKSAVRDYKFLEKNGKLIPARQGRRTFLEWFYDNLDWVSGGLILIYVICIRIFGFLLPSIVYLFLQIMLYTTKEKRNYVLYLVLSVVIPCVIYFLFRNYFYLMLPQGILG